MKLQPSDRVSIPIDEVVESAITWFEVQDKPKYPIYNLLGTLAAHSEFITSGAKLHERALNEILGEEEREDLLDFIKYAKEMSAEALSDDYYSVGEAHKATGMFLSGVEMGVKLAREIETIRSEVRTI